MGELHMIQALLTIDDVSSRNTPAIVDYLNDVGIRAILFGVGENLEKYPEQAAYALSRGMIIGNHSDTHPAFSGLSYETCVREIEACEAKLDGVYRAAGVERKYRPFRFPYGDKGGANKGALQAYLKEKGFDKVDDTRIPYSWWREQGLDADIDTFWTFDFAEYNIRPGSSFTLEDVFRRIDDRRPEARAAILQDGSKHILLLHAHGETEALAPEYYRRFIDRLLEAGVRFAEPEFI